MFLLRWPYNISLVSLLLLPGLIALGFWQLDRASFKESLGTRLVERAQLPAIADEWLTDDVDSWVFRRITLDEQVLWKKEVLLLDNAIRRGKPGVEVIQLAEYKGQLFLVNRGWISWPERSQLPDITVTQVAYIHGQLRDWPKGGLQLTKAPKLVGEVQLVVGLDKPAIEAWLGRSVANALVYLGTDHPNAYEVREIVPTGNGVPAMRHYGYAVQWFSLAVALVLLNVWVWLRHRRYTVRPTT